MKASALVSESRSYESIPKYFITPWKLLGLPSTERLEINFRLFDSSPLVRFSIGVMHWLLVNDADALKHVLQDNYLNYTKGASYEHLKLFLGEGLLTSEGGFWLRQRRLIQPAFHKQKLASLVRIMDRAIDELLDKWEVASKNGETIDIPQEMVLLSMTIVARCLFSTDTASSAKQMGSTLTQVLHGSEHRIFEFIKFPLWFPFPRYHRYRRALRELDAHIFRIIGERRSLLAEGGEEPHDLLSMLFAVQDADTAEKMSDKQIRDEVLTLFLAGHETTASAMSWSFFMMSKHPSHQKSLREEAQRVMGNKTPQFSDFANLDLTHRFFQEVLRLFPPAWTFERRTKEDDSLLGFRIPAGTTLGISPLHMHRNPTYWSNPEGFDPDRFLPEEISKRPKFAYLPFGGGPRVCMGNQFATIETQLLIAKTLQRFRISLVPGQSVDPELAITLRLKAGTPMRLERI